MASSSSFQSSTSLIPRNDVFLSFSGGDTRDCFISHLYSALTQKKIETFIDNRLTKGGEISQSLLDAIEASAISVVIFSKKYASSRWCLDELLKILECRKNYGQIVIPVFYHVEPSEVRHQTGNFGTFFSRLGNFGFLFSKLRGGADKKERWRKALMEAANLSGFHSRVIRPESKLIEEITDEVLKRLNDRFQSENKNLVGVELIIKEIELLLSSGSVDVFKLGVWGIGGIGKTTIAEAIFDKISRHFEGSYFARNVREADETGGIAHLRQELFCTLLNDANVKNFPTAGSNFQRKRLSRKKVLIVLDDVNHLDQIEFLIGSLDWFASGSQIIITTRDKHVLTNCRVDQIYQMKELVHDDALKLFNQCAFGGDLFDESYIELTRKVIKYAKGVPLALKVLGNFLCGRGKVEWESAIRKLETFPHEKIQKILKISYDGLDEEEKNIFLDIACFFIGGYKEAVISFLDACGFHGEIGLSVLVDKSLVMISDNMIRMHDLLQDMGKEIVRKESIKYPEKRSRLLHHKDIYEVLTKNAGTEEIEGISLDMSKVNTIHINQNTFTKMTKLRFLKFYGENKFKMPHFQAVRFIELRYFHWLQYPLKTLNMHAENLVSLTLSNSKVEQLWDNVQNLVYLKEIDLRNSRQLLKLPDLSQARNLEILILRRCSSLLEIHSSVQYLKKLVYIDVDFCVKLRSFSSSIHSEFLKYLGVRSCTNLKKFPEMACCDIKIEKFDLIKCLRLESIPNSLCKLKSLEWLEIINCPNLQRLPDQLGNLKALKILKVNGAAIRELPSSIGRLNKPGELLFVNCGLMELPQSLGQLSSLQKLILIKNNFERIPESIKHLCMLEWVELSYCERLQTLPELPCNLWFLKSYHCTSLKAISGVPISFGSRVELRNCFKLELSELCEIVFNSLQKIQLKATAQGKSSKWRIKSQLQRLPHRHGNLEASEELIVEAEYVGAPKNLYKLPFKRCRGHQLMSLLLPGLNGLLSLTGLSLVDCGITELPKSLGNLFFLKELNLAKNNFERIPESIIQLSKLERLSLRYCERLQTLPELPCNLWFLEAHHCTSLEAVSFIQLSKLECLNLSYCERLQTLPELPSNLRFLKANYCKSLEVVSGSSISFDAFVDFSNCFKLDLNEVFEIVKDGLQKFQLETSARWWHRIQWKPDKAFEGVGRIHMNFPGNEIPKGYRYQSVGSSITFPPGSLNNKLLGFAFCAIVPPASDFPIINWVYSLRFEFKCKSNYCYWNVDCFVGGRIDCIEWYWDTIHSVVGI